MFKMKNDFISSHAEDLNNILLQYEPLFEYAHSKYNLSKSSLKYEIKQNLSSLSLSFDSNFSIDTVGNNRIEGLVYEVIVKNILGAKNQYGKFGDYLTSNNLSVEFKTAFDNMLKYKIGVLITNEKTQFNFYETANFIDFITERTFPLTLYRADNKAIKEIIKTNYNKIQKRILPEYVGAYRKEMLYIPVEMIKSAVIIEKQI
ncbi:MAG: hypothetical protein QXL51_04485 [Candidatus Aenigmatarchaeota archaeon]